MTLLMVPYRLALVPPLRALLLRLYGARIGKRVVLHGRPLLQPVPARSRRAEHRRRVAS
jgi:hypothetical protein